MKTAQRIIVRTDENIEIAEAIELVGKVIAEGRISDDGKGYCYHTAFGIKSGAWQTHVFAIRNKNSDTFYVYKVTQ